MNVELHIDRLVLDGVDLPPARRELLRAGVVAELTRLLAEGGGRPPVGGAVDRVRAPSVTGGPDVAELGRQIAGAIHRAALPDATAVTP